MKTQQQSGLTLVELMVAIVIGMLLVTAVIYLFVSSKQTYNFTDRMSRLNESGRFAVGIITEELRHVDFWGESRPEDVQLDTNLDAIGTDCNGDAAGYSFTSPFFVVTSTGANMIGCLTDAAVGSDVLVIKHVAQTPTTAGALQAGRTYLASNASKAILFDGADTAPTTSAGGDVPSGQYWEYLATVYYVRDNGVDPPALFRRRLMGNTWSASQEVALGVERMQVELGVDDNGDGNANSFYPPNTADFKKVVSARIHLLARSDTQDPGYTDTRKYHLGSVDFGPTNDAFRRVVFNTSASLRNRRLVINGGS